MCSSIPGCGGGSIALAATFLGGLLLSSVVGDLPSSDGELPKAIAKTSTDQQLPVPEPLHNTEPSSPYEMVAHSDYNNRLLVQLKAPTSGHKEAHGGTPSFVTTLLSMVPTRKRSSNDIPRRTRYSPAPTTTEENPHRTLLTPGRYYDSYGEWHHSADDSTHWATHPHGPTQLYYNQGSSANWDWKPHPQHHHQQQQHHSNVLAEILDVTALYPPYHHQQQQGLGLGLQLFVLLHPVLMLGTVSFLVCLINAVLGLVDKVKLPLVRAQEVDRISAGTSTPAGLRDGLDQLYQHLNVAIDHQQYQQRNDTFVQRRS